MLQGPTTRLRSSSAASMHINFSLDDYKENIKKVLRWQGAGFVRGVTLHKCGKWEARIGHLRGKKLLAIPCADNCRFVYLGMYDTEMDATKTCDKATMDNCWEESETSFEEEPKAAVWDDLQCIVVAWGSEPDLEFTLGCSGGSGGDHSTTIIGGHAAAPGSQRTILTEAVRASPSPALGCLDRDHHPSNMLQMLCDTGQISGGGRAEVELHMLGWPTGNHWLPYAATVASSGFPPAPGLEAAMADIAQGSATERLFRWWTAYIGQRRPRCRSNNNM
ncbi:unnamed protein product [Alopecurus aequalis]